MYADMTPEHACPHCGDENWTSEYRMGPKLGVAIVCSKCGMRGPWAGEWNLAVLYWDALPRENKEDIYECLQRD